MHERQEASPTCEDNPSIRGKIYNQRLHLHVEGTSLRSDVHGDSVYIVPCTSVQKDKIPVTLIFKDANKEEGLGLVRSDTIEGIGTYIETGSEPHIHHEFWIHKFITGPFAQNNIF